MSVAAKQRQLFETLEVVPDRQERLAAIVERGRRGPALPSAQRIPANRVAGCVSPVWLIAECKDDRLFFRAEAEAPVVNGLVRLICDIYNGGSPADVASFEPTLLEDLDLIRDITPTRRNGLAAVRRRIREVAAQYAEAGK